MPDLQDFPICFAETNNNQESNEFYVEWLDNNEEFPSLTNTDWEMLKRKELDDIHLVSLEEDWSTLDNKPYAKIAEDASCLQPLKRTIQPLWTNTINEKKSTKIEEEQEDEEGCLGEDLMLSQKERSRKSARRSRKQHLHGLKMMDIQFNGFLRLVTYNGKTEASWHARPIEKDSNSLLEEFGIQTKSQALHYSSRFLNNYKKYTFGSFVETFDRSKNLTDNGDYSVQAPIIKRITK